MVYASDAERKGPRHPIVPINTLEAMALSQHYSKIVDWEFEAQYKVFFNSKSDHPTSIVVHYQQTIECINYSSTSL